MELIRIDKNISKKSTAPHWEIVAVEDSLTSCCSINSWNIHLEQSAEEIANDDWSAYDYHYIINTPHNLEIVQYLDSIEIGTMTYWEEDHHGEYGAGTSLEWGCGLSYWGCLLDIGGGIDLSKMTNQQIVETLIRYSNDCEYTCWAGTREQWNERESERERKELEDTAAAFAGECGHPVGTPAYVHAIHRALAGALNDYDDDRNGERRMERWAAHQYCGTTSSFWEDEDYINGQHMSRLGTLEMVLEWLNKNCPLLMLKINEQRREEENDLVEA